MKYRPKIGKAFPLDKAEIEARTKYMKEKSRWQIVLIMSLAVPFSLISAFAISIATQDFSYLETVWMVLAAPLGAIIAHYFSGNSDNDKNNNKSAT